MSFTPRVYQQAIISHIVMHKRCAVLAGMGMGKTSSTLAALDYLNIIDDTACRLHDVDLMLLYRPRALSRRFHLAPEMTSRPRKHNQPVRRSRVPVPGALPALASILLHSLFQIGYILSFRCHKNLNIKKPAQKRRPGIKARYCLEEAVAVAVHRRLFDRRSGLGLTVAALSRCGVLARGLRALSLVRIVRI